jgi:hypothetical protein
VKSVRSRRLEPSTPSARSRVAVRSALALALVLSSGLAVSCGPGAPPERAARRELAPQWQDVFDGTPEIYVVLRPQAIKRDALYGTFFKNVLRVAQARSAMRGATTLEALEGAEEIIVGIRKNEQGEDAALVIRGVPANLDPQTMTDAGGRPVLHLRDARASVPEYEFHDRQSAGAGSVFVLPDRTWVGVIGEARARARQAFAAPFGRPAPKVDAEALAIVRLDASTFLRSPRFTKSPLVGPLTKKLRALSLTLMPGKGGVVARLQYEDEDASAWAEMHVKRVLEELSQRESSRGVPGRAGAPLDWLRSARVGHEGNTVVVTVAVPARLLEDLPNATAGDLSL